MSRSNLSQLKKYFRLEPNYSRFYQRNDRRQPEVILRSALPPGQKIYLIPGEMNHVLITNTRCPHLYITELGPALFVREKELPTLPSDIT